MSLSRTRSGSAAGSSRASTFAANYVPMATAAASQAPFGSVPQCLRPGVAGTLARRGQGIRHGIQAAALAAAPLARPFTYQNGAGGPGPAVVVRSTPSSSAGCTSEFTGAAAASCSEPLRFDEERLRDEAAAEVAVVLAREREESEGSGGNKAGKRKRKLTGEEKAQHSRDRNKEHARNTRMRKKAFVDKLKVLHDDLTKRKRDDALQERVREDRKTEQERVRIQGLQTFLRLRASGCEDRRQWQTLVDKSFMFTYPSTTPDTGSAAATVHQKAEVGLAGLLADTAAFRLALSLIGRGRQAWAAGQAAGGRVEAFYELDLEGLHAQGETVSCSYALQTTNAVACGAAREVRQNGMLMCKFSAANQILSLDLVYDVLSHSMALRAARGAPDEPARLVAETLAQFPARAAPATLDEALALTDQACIVTTVGAPYAITHANAAWSSLCGFPLSEAIGAHPNMLQNPQTDRKALSEMMVKVRRGQPAAANVINRRKDGSLFNTYLRVYPITAASAAEQTAAAAAAAVVGVHNTPPVTHYCGLLEPLPDLANLTQGSFSTLSQAKLGRGFGSEDGDDGSASSTGWSSTSDSAGVTDSSGAYTGRSSSRSPSRGDDRSSSNDDDGFVGLEGLDSLDYF